MPTPTKRPRQLAFDLESIEEIAPVRVRRIMGELRAFPDLKNYFPARVVTRAEALLYGWPLYCEMKRCRAGHIAPRYVAGSGDQCIDCRRVREGKPLIGISVAPAEAAVGADMPGC